MRKNSYLTVTDQFCGAGGSSQGVRAASKKMKGGLEVKLALNHWKLAIETHQTNFQDTIHECTDISACDPRRYPSTDILITSPECTNHSLAKGKKAVKNQMDLFASGKLDAAAERSRATMWDVCRFAEYHRYNAIIVGNVVDARKWVMWDSWLMAMHSLGYSHKCVYLNSMHMHPTPQSRDRMYVVFWRKGNKAPNLEHTPKAYCPNCGGDVNSIQSWKRPDMKFGKYRQQYVYRCPVHGNIVEPYYYAAFNCIDWSDIGKRIGDREKPLSLNTTKRIEYGLNRFGKQPMLMHAAYSEHARGVIREMDREFFTQTTLQSQAIVSPMIVNDQHSTGVDCRVKSTKETFPTIPTASHLKLVVPFIIKGEHTLQEGYVKQVTENFQTQTVRQSMALVTPYIVEMNRTGKAKPATEPASTFTAGGINHAVVNAPLMIENMGKSTSRGSIEPLSTITTKPHHGLITTEAFNSFIQYYYNGHQVSGINEAADTITTKDRMALVNFSKPRIEDCYYRMIKAHEVKLAMAFDRDYVILGNSRDQVKQCGNAVTPPAMEWLVERIVESLG